MDTYKAHATVKNGQLIIDLPAEFDNIEVEILISRLTTKSVSDEETKPYISDSEDTQLLEEPAVLAYQIPSVTPNEVVDESEFIQPRQKIDISKFRGCISKETGQKMIEDIENANELSFIPPRENIKLSTLMGAYKNKMTNDEIDSLTKSWRNEWNRDFS